MLAGEVSGRAGADRSAHDKQVLPFELEDVDDEVPDRFDVGEYAFFARLAFVY